MPIVQPRTRFAVLVAAALVLAAVLAPCGDDASDLRTESNGRVVPAEDEPEAERPERRRVRRSPTGGGDVLTHRDGGPLPRLLRSGSVGLAPDDTAAPPSGRVNVLLLKDGEPFRGGHVCFFAESQMIEPAEWDGIASSDGAYFSVPHYKPLWPHFDPVLGSARPVNGFAAERGITGADGRVSVDVPVDLPLVVFVRYRRSGIPLRSMPRIRLAQGEEVELTLEAATERTVMGRCIDDAGRPLVGILVQAVAPLAERPVSRMVETDIDGRFTLPVFGDDSEVRLRAVVSYIAHPLPMHRDAAELPSIPADTTVHGVVPGGLSIDVRMPAAPVVLVELRSDPKDSPLQHLQIEGMVFDARASAWGRLGGPQYRRSPAGGGTVFVAIPRDEARRPLMLWSWGWTLTAVDPRGRERMEVEITRGRRAGVVGRGWRASDRLRVIAFCGPEGAKLPCIWIDGALGERDAWHRDDCPIDEMEFQIVRDGRVIGRSARVPPGRDTAEDVRIDLE
jgi:hypothetical protein